MPTQQEKDQNLIHRSFCLERERQRSIIGDLRFIETSQALPLIVVLHGFRAHKDWGFFPYLCAELSAFPAYVLNFNFSLNGYCGSTTDKTLSFSIEDFAANTIAQELQDAQAVLKAWKQNALGFSELQWDGRIFLLGHSRGAGIALLLCERDTDIRAASLWSPIKNFDRTTPRQKAVWRERGVLEVAQSESGPAYAINISFLEDLEKHQQEYSLTRAIAQCHIPLTGVVGSQDMVTRPSEAQELFTKYPAPGSKLHVLAQCGHSFNSTHPFRTASACLLSAVQITQRSFAEAYTTS